jgi:hypothetical protein
LPLVAHYIQQMIGGESLKSKLDVPLSTTIQQFVAVSRGHQCLDAGGKLQALA